MSYIFIAYVGLFFIFCYSHHRQYIRTKFSFITFALQIKLTFEGHLRFVRSAGGSYGKATTSKLFSFLVTKSFNKMRNFVAKTSLVCVVVFVSLVIVFCWFYQKKKMLSQFFFILLSQNCAKSNPSFTNHFMLLKHSELHWVWRGTARLGLFPSHKINITIKMPHCSHMYSIFPDLVPLLCCYLVLFSPSVESNRYMKNVPQTYRFSDNHLWRTFPIY